METSLLIIVGTVVVAILVLIIVRRVFGGKGGSKGPSSAGSPDGKLQATLRARARVEEARDKNYRRLKELEAKAEGVSGTSQEAEALKAIMACIGEISKQEGSINNLISDYNNIEVSSFRQRSFEVQRSGSQRAMWEYLLFLEGDNTKTRQAIFELSDAIVEIENGAKTASSSSSSSSPTFNRGVIKGALLTRRVSYRDRCISLESEIDALLKAMLNPILRRRNAEADGGLVEEAAAAFEGMWKEEERVVEGLVREEKEFSAKFGIEREMKFRRLNGVFCAAAEYLKGEKKEEEGEKEGECEKAIVEILAPLSKAAIPGVIDNEYKELLEKIKK